MLQTLWLGIRLRCPNCGQGHMSGGLFHIHETCHVCNVRFERKDGESTGASIVALSFLPIPAIAIAFFLMFAFPDLPFWVVFGVPAVLIVLTCLLGYRHARGLWIAVVKLTDGLYTDEELAERLDGNLG